MHQHCCCGAAPGARGSAGTQLCVLLGGLWRLLRTEGSISSHHPKDSGTPYFDLQCLEGYPGAQISEDSRPAQGPGSLHRGPCRSASPCGQTRRVKELLALRLQSVCPLF